MTITRRIRPYRNAKTFEDYLAIKEETGRRAAASPIPYVPPPRALRRDLTPADLFGAGPFDAVSPPPYVPAAATGDEEEERDDDDDQVQQTPMLRIADLHPIVLAACEKRFQRGHFRDGVLAAILAYRDLVRERSGLNENNDSTLMGKAFGGKPTPALVIADLASETGKNRQRGMAQLSEGLLAFVRNPLTHDSSEIEPQEALRMIALIDMLVRRVDATPVPAAAMVSDGETPTNAG